MDKQELATKFLRRFDALVGQRVNYERIWERISGFVFSGRDHFLKTLWPGQMDRVRSFDTTAALANNLLASTLHGGLIGPQSNWMNLRVSGVNKLSDEATMWIAQASGKVLEAMCAPEGGFVSQAHTFLLSNTGYGTAAMFIGENDEGQPYFSTINLTEMFIVEDEKGCIDTVFRKFKYSARQAYQRWGDKIHPRMQDLLESDPDRQSYFLHIVMPRDDPSQLGLKSDKMPVASYYVDMDNGYIVNESGFHEMPYAISRFYVLVGETYGRSPAWDALPNIQVVNAMSRSALRAQQLQESPILLVADDGIMGPIQSYPNGIVVGGLSMDGTPRVQPLNVGNNIQGLEQSIELRRKQIRDLYFVDQLIPKDGTPITATEAMQQQDAFLRLLSPQIARIQSEFLEPVIKRTFNILLRNGKLGKIPPELTGKKLKIDYLGPLAKLQKQQNIVGLQKYMNIMGPLAQVMPESLNVLSPTRLPAMIAEEAGLSPLVLRTSTELQQQNQKQQQQESIQQAAQVVGSAAQLGKAFPGQGNQPIQ